MKNKPKMIDSCVMTNEIFSYRNLRNPFKLPKVNSLNKLENKINKQYLFLQTPIKHKKISFITEFLDNTKINFDKTLSQEINKKKNKKYILYDFIGHKKELKQLNLRTLSNDIDFKSEKNSFIDFPTFRTITLKRENELNKKKKDRVERYVLNFREFFLRKQNRNLLSHLKKRNLLPKSKLLENLKEKTKCYLDYLNKMNIRKINITNDKRINDEKKIDSLFKQIKKHTGEELDKMNKEFEL